MKTLKYSRQRESIKACLMGRKDYPTADALYTSIRGTVSQHQSGNCISKFKSACRTGGNPQAFLRRRNGSL